MLLWQTMERVTRKIFLCLLYKGGRGFVLTRKVEYLCVVQVSRTETYDSSSLPLHTSYMVPKMTSRFIQGWEENEKGTKGGKCIKRRKKMSRIFGGVYRVLYPHFMTFTESCTCKEVVYASSPRPFTFEDINESRSWQWHDTLSRRGWYNRRTVTMCGSRRKASPN